MDNHKKINPIKVSNDREALGSQPLLASDNTLVGFSIMEKKCSKCKLPKELEEFTKRKKNKSGVAAECKMCMVKRVKKDQRTKRGLITRIYNHQIHTTKKNHTYNKVNYTKEELINWVISQPLFHELYDNWVKSGYQKMLRPSCDRTDDYQGYSLNRLQLMTWGENRAKGHLDMKNGINNKNSKTVIGIHKTTGKKVEFYSMAQAERATDILQGNISSCCRGQRKTAGRYLWGYKNYNN
jgi:hypothetical protein